MPPLWDLWHGDDTATPAFLTHTSKVDQTSARAETCSINSEYLLCCGESDVSSVDNSVVDYCAVLIFIAVYLQCHFGPVIDTAHSSPWRLAAASVPVRCFQLIPCVSKLSRAGAVLKMKSRHAVILLAEPNQSKYARPETSFSHLTALSTDFLISALLASAIKSHLKNVKRLILLHKSEKIALDEYEILFGLSVPPPIGSWNSVRVRCAPHIGASVLIQVQLCFYVQDVPEPHHRGCLWIHSLTNAVIKQHQYGDVGENLRGRFSLSTDIFRGIIRRKVLKGDFFLTLALQIQLNHNDLKLNITCSTCCHGDPTRDEPQTMHGWMSQSVVSF
ncbi:hypothetical protein F2P81_011999 [Scophthalmus maximus]|uniref:Uncharacterized protein n=1 Tax=Scophthalmus maximus TaxID=52904 RepID=A0A6A4STC6_SCOMX|nr:hypothetical protein F2P81_011999 [Scophthalmus maximus]